MTTTTEYTLAVDSGWNQVSTGSASVTIQLQSDGPVLVHIGTSSPGSGSMVGVILDNEANTELSANGLSGTDNVYVRSFFNNADKVTVFAS